MTSPRAFTAYVPGKPAPQGSKRHVGGGRMVEASVALGPWRDAIAYRVASIMRRTAHPGYPRTVALDLVAQFTMPRGVSVRRDHPTVTPDLDKLVRGVCDGLTISGLIADDAQIVTIFAAKLYTHEGGRPPGVLVHLRQHEKGRDHDDLDERREPDLDDDPDDPDDPDL